MTYEEFLTAKRTVLSQYPTAVCKEVVGDNYAWIKYYVYPDAKSTAYFTMLGSSEINEPDAWKVAAEDIEAQFLYKLES